MQKHSLIAQSAPMYLYVARLYMLFSSVTLEVNDAKTYLTKVSAGSLRAGGYRRLLEENTESGLQQRKHDH